MKTIDNVRRIILFNTRIKKVYDLRETPYNATRMEQAFRQS